MRRDVLTDEEKAYIYSFRPAGFLRTWNALYDTKVYRCWRIGRMAWLAFEKQNRRPGISRTTFDGFWGWSIVLPIGVGTIAAWGYLRREAA